MLMTYGYNKSYLKLSETTLHIIFDSKHLNKNTLFFYRQISNYLTLELIKSLDDNFKGLSDLRRLFRILASLGGFLRVGTFININNNLDYEIQEDYALQFYYLPKEIKVQRWVTFSKKDQERLGKRGQNLTDRYFVNVPISERKLNLRKSQNALLPNLTHHIDANLMFYSVDYLLERNIDVV